MTIFQEKISLCVVGSVFYDLFINLSKTGVIEIYAFIFHIITFE